MGVQYPDIVFELAKLKKRASSLDRPIIEKAIEEIMWQPRREIKFS